MVICATSLPLPRLPRELKLLTRLREISYCFEVLGVRLPQKEAKPCSFLLSSSNESSTAPATASRPFGSIIIAAKEVKFNHTLDSPGLQG